MGGKDMGQRGGCYRKRKEGKESEVRGWKGMTGMGKGAREEGGKEQETYDWNGN